MNPETEDDVRRREADRLLAAAIYLMSCHARNGCPRLAYMVKRHFELIARHPESGELVRDTCKRLAAAWESIGRHDLRVAASSPASGETGEVPKRLVH